MSYDVTDFTTDVLEQSKTKPVLVDFWAEWCQPCKMLTPVLEHLAEKHQDSWTFAKVDTEKFPEIANEYGVRGIPNVKLFADGKVVDEFTGVQPDYAIEQWLQRALPSKHAKDTAHAEQLIADENTTEARAVLERVLVEAPDNEHARVLMAQLCIFSNPQRAEELVENVLADSRYYDKAESVRAFARFGTLMAQPEALPEGEQKEVYLAAIAAVEQRNFDAALDGFINVIREDRYYDDDGSRKACIAIFKYLGEEHDITRKHRRSFDSALY